jgi:predicted RNA-binding Zn ribbon-like protein
MIEWRSMEEDFRLVAGNLALDFANTLDNRYDPERLLELLSTYERFLAFAAQSGIITQQQARMLLAKTRRPNAGRSLERAIELRETLYSLFESVATGKAPDPSCLRTFNRFLADARVPEAVTWRKPDFIRCSCDLTETPEGPLWPIVDAAANLLTSPDRYHVHECIEETCRWLFVDRSKNHSRRWCDMKVCGNRSKAHRFYSRLRSNERLSSWPKKPS